MIEVAPSPHKPKLEVWSLVKGSHRGGGGGGGGGDQACGDQCSKPEDTQAWLIVHWLSMWIMDIIVKELW